MTPAWWWSGSAPSAHALERRAGELGVDALFTGPLEHRHLRHLLALADACVVPSVFPEAFGMVAAEAAAAGCPPLVSRHSGLAEVAAGLEAAYPDGLRDLAGFPTGDSAALRAQLERLLSLPAAERRAIRAGGSVGGARAMELGQHREAPARPLERVKAPHGTHFPF